MGIDIEIHNLFEKNDKKLFLPTWEWILKFVHRLYKEKKLKFFKCIQTWHGSSPQIYKTNGENGRSVAITVLELWHFLRSNLSFYHKRANFNVKSVITQEPL